ncbi:MAG: secondary thiamine-phosphate synthase enzyme YjbQ [Natronomonas sp.]
MSRNRFTVETESRTEVRDITERVEAAVASSDGETATVFVRHTTAGVTVNEAEVRLLEDFELFLERLVPSDGWAHDEIDDNADSHMRAMLLGSSVTVPVSDGVLDLGTWGSVLLVECDGPRRRTVDVIY